MEIAIDEQGNYSDGFLLKCSTCSLVTNIRQTEGILWSFESIDSKLKMNGFTSAFKRLPKQDYAIRNLRIEYRTETGKGTSRRYG